MPFEGNSADLTWPELDTLIQGRVVRYAHDPSHFPKFFACSADMTSGITACYQYARLANTKNSSKPQTYQIQSGTLSLMRQS